MATSSKTTSSKTTSGKTHMSTWTCGAGHTITGNWLLGEQVVQVSNSMGEVWQELMSSWLDRLEALIADGWWQIA